MAKGWEEMCQATLAVLGVAEARNSTAGERAPLVLGWQREDQGMGLLKREES